MKAFQTLSSRTFLSPILIRRGAIALLAGVLALAAASYASGQSAGLKTIDNPGGGQVVYGVFDQESTLQGAMVAMLHKIHTNLGERPQIGQFFETRDRRTLGTFFTLTAKNKTGRPVSGMVLVTMPSGLKPAAAVLYDEANHFSASEPQLMKKLTEAFGKVSGSSAGSSAKQGSTNSSAPSSSPSSHGSPAPVAPLHDGVASDNSASIGLPAGWHVTGGGGGSIHAEGPKGESIHMGVINQNIYDPNTQQGRNMIAYMSKGRTPFTVCPFTNDLVAAYQCVSRQDMQRNHRPQISMRVLNTTNVRSGLLVAAEIDFNDGKGPMKSSILIGTIRSGPAMWALTVSQVSVPDALADEEWPTVTAMAASYKQNGRVVQAEGDQAVARIHEQAKITQARIDAHNQQVDQQKKDFESHMDNLDRDSKARQNYNLDQSVLQDSMYPARGTVSNPTADAFVKANPDRFQIVPQSDWIKGQDY